MFWKIIKFVIKWSLIAFALYIGFWLALIVLLEFLLFGGLMCGIQTAPGPSGEINSDHYNDNDRYF